MASQEFQILTRRAQALARRFLNKRVMSNQSSALSQDMIKAFRLLMHAELEYYIEQVTINKASALLKEWNTKGKVSRCLLAILAYSGSAFPNVPTQMSDVNSGNDLKFRVNTATARYISQIRARNNGIKETDLVPMLVPLGMTTLDVDQTLLNNLSSYGSRRGDVAHKSHKVISLINPQDEVSNIGNILHDLQKLDKAILSLR